MRRQEDEGEGGDNGNSNIKHVVIVGAGIAGLVASKELLSPPSPPPFRPSPASPVRITLVEASHRIGGRLYRHNCDRKGRDGGKGTARSAAGGGCGDDGEDDENDDDGSSSSSSWAGDLGAELVHGKDTLLTHYFDELRGDGAWGEEWEYAEESETKKKKNDGISTAGTTTTTTTTTHTTGYDGEAGTGATDDDDDDSFYSEFYITAHADGGPDERGPTRDGGKYGMYYLNGQLLKYDHPDVVKLTNALGQVLEPTSNGDNDEDDLNNNAMTSVGEALRNNVQPPLPDHLHSLAVASYGNTAGSTDLNQLSLPIIQKFEKYWEENESAGDYQPPPSVGLWGLADQIHRKYLSPDPRFRLNLNWKVKSITAQEQANSNNNNSNLLRVASDNDDECVINDVDAVIVTVPPPLLSQIDMDLPPSKKEALKYVGYERTVKVCVKFNKRLWPERVQGIVCADDYCLVPEMWFGEYQYSPRRRRRGAKSGSSPSPDLYYYKVVAFLVSGAADAFMERIHESIAGSISTTTTAYSSREEMAAELILSQLSKIFQVPKSDFEKSYEDIVLYDWQQDNPYVGGGYMYPRVGMRPAHLHELAAPISGRNIFFAGEATNTDACCTVQAAMETGVRAAREVAAALLEV